MEPLDYAIMAVIIVIGAAFIFRIPDDFWEIFTTKPAIVVCLIIGTLFFLHVSYSYLTGDIVNSNEIGLGFTAYLFAVIGFFHRRSLADKNQARELIRKALRDK